MNYGKELRKISENLGVDTLNHFFKTELYDLCKNAASDGDNKIKICLNSFPYQYKYIRGVHKDFKIWCYKRNLKLDYYNGSYYYILS